MTIPESAMAFARSKHEGQTRRDGHTPYITHPARVAERLGNVGVRDPEILAAAVLHDTIEDTPTTHPELESRFGKAIADLVEEVTRRPGVTRREFTERLLECSPRAVLIRLADRLDNLRDGTGLGAAFLPVYAQEALRMLRHALQNPRLPELDPEDGEAFLRLAAELIDAAAYQLPHYKGDSDDERPKPRHARRRC